MEIAGQLYFAPGILFSALDAKSPAIVDCFRARVEGFYLEPAQVLCELARPFPAGVLLVSSADALARYDSRIPSSEDTNKKRYTWWLQNNLPSFSAGNLARDFYQDFRCGLVHEARIKKGSIFTVAIGGTVFIQAGVMAVNPRRLLDELRTAAERLYKHLRESAAALALFQTALESDFAAELAP